MTDGVFQVGRAPYEAGGAPVLFLEYSCIFRGHFNSLCTLFSAESKKRRKPPETGSCSQMQGKGQESIACG